MFIRIHNHARVASAEGTANRAATKADQSQRQIQELESQVEALSLACQAMWEITRDRLSITDDQLRDKIEEIDLRDGKLDGRMGPNTKLCPKCERRSNSKRRNCLYCGEPMVAGDHVFDV